ncbi:hypothetical protein [Streptomyces sp. ISID311]|uniref:hypothetical protein n=1 Tax=Streptomyces sp. ISID311 TaxID=2601673 RepID=UPI0011BD3158|nr:hypothetical protein [Streptomyces sp. ISID311]TXC93982.1 hypothetical protein FS847_29210 [Streptomyces sp. ISID311]
MSVRRSLLSPVFPFSLRPPAVGRLFRRPAAARDPGAGGTADTADTAPDDTAHRTARRLLEEAGLL